jgi:ribosomal protein S18 acetylase RimI-like enzyme
VDSRSKDQDLAAKKPLAQVITIVVAPGHQRQGIGRTLSERAIAYLKNTPARAVRLEVDAAKAAPIALYKKLGFVQRAVIPSPRGPAIIMTLPLKD